MPRQNRVNPFGDLIAADVRGTFMGNRGGVLHNANGDLTARRWASNRWIICLLEFKGRRRPVMAPGCYTELFFCDEAMALAAGHRPCWECRRDAFVRFRQAWLRGNPQYGFANDVRIEEIDQVLQGERVTPSGHKVTFASDFESLPEGTMIVLPKSQNAAGLVWQGRVYPWSWQGYGPPTALATSDVVQVLTPRSTVNALRAGFVPEVRLHI